MDNEQQPQQQVQDEFMEEGKPDPKQEGSVAENSETQQDEVRQFTDEQMGREVLCRTFEGEIVEAPWHLMVQSRTFTYMWDSLGLEDSFYKPGNEPFIFSLNDIGQECFVRILEWMQQHHGLPEPTVKENPSTSERIWFEFTEWERNFFDVDFEVVKEYYLAANFLDLRSLYLYCAQECARCIMDKEPEVIREMLCLEDDLTDEDKARIYAEFDTPPKESGGQPGPSGTSGVQAGWPGPSGTSGVQAGRPGPSGTSGVQAGQPGPSGTSGVQAGQPGPSGTSGGQPMMDEIVNGHSSVADKNSP